MGVQVNDRDIDYLGGFGRRSFHSLPDCSPVGSVFG